MPLLIFTAINSEKIALNTDHITMISRDRSGYYAVKTAGGVVALITEEPERVVRRCLELARAFQDTPNTDG